jgi:hypothetical protein
MKCLANIEENQIILSVENIETEEFKNIVCEAFLRNQTENMLRHFQKIIQR